MAGVIASGDVPMSKPRDDRQKDLFRPSLDEIVAPGHRLVRLGREIDWGFLDDRFSSVCAAGPGHPPLPTRLVAGLLILKHMHNLSDEVLCQSYVRVAKHAALMAGRYAHAEQFKRHNRRVRLLRTRLGRLIPSYRRNSGGGKLAGKSDSATRLSNGRIQRVGPNQSQGTLVRSTLGSVNCCIGLPFKDILTSA